MASDFVQELGRLRKPVWKILQSYLPAKYPRKHYRMIRDYPERQGKYLRPGLLLLSTAMLGGSQQKSLLLAAAVQASEEWLLIHDDIEDSSEFRRSTKNQPRPTLQKLHGEALAINAGDALHILMWRILGDAVKEMDSKLGWQIFYKMNDMLLTTTEGQFLDLAWIKHNDLSIGETDYYKMVYKKSAYYSIVGPLQLGAMAADESSKQTLAAIQKWATPLGYAFQIRDDLINLTQDSEVSGKELGGDILEGKRTLMLIHLLRHCSKMEKNQIGEIYGKERENKTETEKKHIINLMNKHGSLAYGAKTVTMHCRSATIGFNKFAANFPNSPAKARLKQAIEFIDKRVF